jgi:DNA-binding transcriptional ArsR family regulator
MGTHVSRGADVQAVLDGVRRIVQALRASSRWAERHVGLSGAQLFVLQKLAETPAISVNELAERTHTHQSSVSAVISRLAELGLVTRKRSAADGPPRRAVAGRPAPGASSVARRTSRRSG